MFVCLSPKIFCSVILKTLHVFQLKMKILLFFANCYLFRSGFWIYFDTRRFKLVDISAHTFALLEFNEKMTHSLQNFINGIFNMECMYSDYLRDFVIRQWYLAACLAANNWQHQIRVFCRPTTLSAETKVAAKYHCLNIIPLSCHEWVSCDMINLNMT